MEVHIRDGQFSHVPNESYHLNLIRNNQTLINALGYHISCVISGPLDKVLEVLRRLFAKGRTLFLSEALLFFEERLNYTLLYPHSIISVYLVASIHKNCCKH